MAGSLNKIMLIGNLGKDPETTHFEGGGLRVKFSLATSEAYTSRAGERVTHTEWHHIVVQRKGLTEVCEKYLKKGQKIYLEGKIRSRSWTDDQNQIRYITEILADHLTMLSSKPEGQNAAPTVGYNAPNAQPTRVIEDFNTVSAVDNDDLPF